MPISRGKDFEAVVKEAFERVPDTVVYRIPDQQNYKIGSKNPCDFLLYRKPNMYAIECKATNKTSLPFANITDFQWEHLLKMSKEKGVVAGILCWYVAFDVTVFIPIQRLQICKEEGLKSINHVKAVSLTDVFVIPGRKKRIFFDYDMQSFFEHFSS